MDHRSLGRSAFIACFAALCVAGCADPVRVDRALAEVEAARREAAVRDGEMKAFAERQAAMGQQLAMVTAIATSALGKDPRRDEEHDQRLGEIIARLGRVDAAITKMRDDEQPKDIDIAAARRLAEQGTPEERAAAVRKVQALLDAGLVKVTVRNGRAQIAILRPLDAQDPYQPAKPAKPETPNKKTSTADEGAKKGKQEIERDRLEFR